jgi:hypothetical protein
MKIFKFKSTPLWFLIPTALIMMPALYGKEFWTLYQTRRDLEKNVLIFLAQDGLYDIEKAGYDLRLADCDQKSPRCQYQLPVAASETWSFSLPEKMASLTSSMTRQVIVEGQQNGAYQVIVQVSGEHSSAQRSVLMKPKSN